MRQVVAAESRITVYGPEGEVVRCPLNSAPVPYCPSNPGSHSFNVIWMEDLGAKGASVTLSRKFDSVIAPGFYMFDGGIRLSRNAVIDFITAQYAAGKRYENVTEPDVDCLCQSKQHHGHVRNRKTDLDGISLSPEKSRHLEDRLLAQHSGP